MASASTSMPSLSLSRSASSDPDNASDKDRSRACSIRVSNPSASLDKSFMSTTQGAGTNSNIEARIDDLMRETRLWRVACSAKWVAWGIVQAHVPGFEERRNSGHQGSENERKRQEDTPREGEEGEDEDSQQGFDYLGYARERALFFWGDCVQLGFVREEELPGDLRRRLKVVDR